MLSPEDLPEKDPAQGSPARQSGPDACTSSRMVHLIPSSDPRVPTPEAITGDFSLFHSGQGQACWASSPAWELMWQAQTSGRQVLLVSKRCYNDVSQTAHVSLTLVGGPGCPAGLCPFCTMAAPSVYLRILCQKFRLTFP